MEQLVQPQVWILPYPIQLCTAQGVFLMGYLPEGVHMHPTISLGCQGHLLLKDVLQPQCYWGVGFSIHRIHLPLQLFCPQAGITQESRNKTVRNNWPAHCHVGFILRTLSYTVKCIYIEYIGLNQ